MDDWKNLSMMPALSSQREGVSILTHPRAVCLGDFPCFRREAAYLSRLTSSYFSDPRPMLAA